MEDDNVQDVEIQETAVETEKEIEQEKKFAQEELNSILAKEKSKWQKKAVEDKEEAQKLAKMNAEEKAKFCRGIIYICQKDRKIRSHLI